MLYIYKYLLMDKNIGINYNSLSITRLLIGDILYIGK